MAKKNKQPEIDFYYMNYGQASNDEKDEKAKRKKAKEREKRIKENRAKQEESFDIDTETVIQMTNRNKIKQEEQRKRKLTQEEKRKKNKKQKNNNCVRNIIVIRSNHRWYNICYGFTDF